MKVYDIFSYVPENELSLESIEERFRLYRYAGKADSDEYDFISDEVPRTHDPDVINCVYELRAEGKKVAFLVADTKIVAVIGYKE